MTNLMKMPIPEGFAPHFRKSPVTQPWEPLYSRIGPASVQIGLALREAHCNSRGLVHGGVIATLADNAMGLSLIQALKDRGGDQPVDVAKGAVTTSLSVDFVATAKLGQWLIIMPRVIKAGRTLGVVDALVTANDVVIARANASFSIVRA